MKAFKVFRRRKDGTLGSLFVDGSRRIEQQRWLRSDDRFNPSWLAVKPGWHSHQDRDKALELLKANPNRILMTVRLRGVRSVQRNGRVVSEWLFIEGVDFAGNSPKIEKCVIS